MSEGKSWGRVKLNTGDEYFTRSTQQKQWMTSEYAQVIEEAHLLNKEQKAIFLGLSNTTSEKGEKLNTTNTQPLFHIEHGVTGTQDQPRNTWRIVHLTKEKDMNLIKEFEKFKNSTSLPRYIEIYIEKDLKITLKRK
ncbi:MAG: hypothetical protein ACRYGR_09665 [Janthinobacterium lividum]